MQLELIRGWRAAVAVALMQMGLAATAAPSTPPTPPKLLSPPARVDINSASLAELKVLPGIGDAEAERIVAARPYPSKAKLVAEGVMSMATFTRLKDSIEARQPQGALRKGTSQARPSP